MKLSIIVPVYNIASFIGPCLDSILSTDLDPSEYEIIVINDGSIDESPQIIEFHAALYKQIKIVHQENIGLGGARNTGINQASGEYIWFVDGDDLAVSDHISTALDIALANKVDVLAFDYLPINESGNPENWIQFKLSAMEGTVYTGPEFYFKNFAKSYVWLYFFKKSIFTDHQLFFHESIKMEDSEIMPKIMAKCEILQYYDQPLIRYRKREGSITNLKEEKARNHFYYSMVKTAESLKSFQSHFAVDTLMYSAIELKRKQINQMLFTNLIGNNYSSAANDYYVELLDTYKILPFTVIQGFSPKMNLKFNLIRKIVNIDPIKGRKIYKFFFNN
jgi:glycosyltransferase involved in cell wall biosynthesis